ncbi:MAG: hypothetical protein QXI60_04890 [Thermofilaceae archaeon]
MSSVAKDHPAHPPPIHFAMESFPPSVAGIVRVSNSYRNTDPVGGGQWNTTEEMDVTVDGCERTLTPQHTV